jgi:TIR domain-containing protein
MAKKKAAGSPLELFLSHSSRDRKFAAKLAAMLRQQGIPVWYSSTHILGARQWHDEIGKALARCDWFAIVLSPDSVRSQWVKRELLYVLNDNRYENRIVPIRYKDCKESALSWILPSIQAVDFTKNYEVGCQALLRIWRSRKRKPLTKGSQ